MYRSIVASALSIKPTKWDKAQNADKLEAFIREAARERPDVIVAPEGFLEGYVVMEVVRDPSKAEAMHALAEPLDGPYIQRFQSVARGLKRNVCFGFAERRDDGIYNCAAFIGSDGELCGTYRKTQLSEGTHPSWDFNRVGRQLRGIDTPIGRVGVLICNDRWNAHIARRPRSWTARKSCLFRRSDRENAPRTRPSWRGRGKTVCRWSRRPWA